MQDQKTVIEPVTTSEVKDNEDRTLPDSSNNEAQTGPPDLKPAKKKRLRLPSKKLLLITGVVLLVLGAIVGAFFLGKKSADPSKSGQDSSSQQKTTQDQAENHTDFVLEKDDITFFDRAKPLGNLNLIDAVVSGNEYQFEEGYDPDEATQYYQIGTTKDGKDLIYFIFGYGLGGAAEYLAVSDKATYTVFTKTYGEQALALKWAKSVALDESFQIPELIAPETAEIRGQKLKTSGFFGRQRIVPPDESASSTTEIGGAERWKFYRTTVVDEPSYQIININARFNNLFKATYNLNGELSRNSDKVLDINWSQGEKNKSIYDNGGYGCGNSGFMIPKSFQKNQLIQVGTSPQGQKLYQLPVSHAFVTELYNKDYRNGEYVGEETLKNLTIQQLTDKHAYFLVENGFGDYVVMLRGDIFIRGGCAKPVVYLYPTKTTSVSVGVGADVTLSEPLYPAGGWRNVIAQPNGNLSYQGKPYESLFWEGYGYGTYPAIKSGTVVRINQALPTISRQLRAQGLNEKETSDFIEFWQTKLPSKPYVRLTWFGNSELEQLAPLYVTPRPTTMIRVFLDMEGLDEPIFIKPQTFSAPERKGFTVTEWGGLARDGSVPPKLR